MKPCTLYLYDIMTLICIGILYLDLVSCTGKKEQDALEQRIIALHQTVDFMAQRPHQMNLDSVFGLTMVEAHIRQTLNHENVRYIGEHPQDLLFDILELCRQSHRQATDAGTTTNNQSVTLDVILNRPDIWMNPISWSSGSLGPRPLPSINNSEESVATIFHKGTPDEPESDKCIVQLANDSMKRICLVSDRCADMLLKDDQPRGYPLTHRLLYVQIAIVLRCNEHESTPFEELISTYCKSALQDAVDMEDAGFPFISRDLICEQVLLCGMEGYTEFVNDHYASLIISWANSARCYSAFGFFDNDQRRSKRETEQMDFGCDNHATSLAAASLSLLIRYSVENLG